MFKRAANRFCVSIPGHGFVPVAQEADDKPVFVCGSPEQIGDDCIIEAEGQLRKARLLKSSGHAKEATYLVDMGPVDKWGSGEH